MPLKKPNQTLKYVWNRHTNRFVTVENKLLLWILAVENQYVSKILNIEINTELKIQ